MELIKKLFDQVPVFRPPLREDCRGSMCIFYSQEALRPYAPEWIPTEQRVYSMPQAGTFFGIHHQPGQAKLICVIEGRGLDYVIDLRRDSPSFLTWKSLELSGDDPKVVYIPSGFGHAFLSLADHTIQLFAADRPFENGIGGVIHYQDPSIGLCLPMPPCYLSDYDANAPYLG